MMLWAALLIPGQAEILIKTIYGSEPLIPAWFFRRYNMESPLNTRLGIHAVMAYHHVRLSSDSIRDRLDLSYLQPDDLYGGALLPLKQYPLPCLHMHLGRFPVLAFLEGLPSSVPNLYDVYLKGVMKHNFSPSSPLTIMSYPPLIQIDNVLRLPLEIPKLLPQWPRLGLLQSLSIGLVALLCNLTRNLPVSSPECFQLLQESLDLNPPILRIVLNPTLDWWDRQGWLIKECQDGNIKAFLRHAMLARLLHHTSSQRDYWDWLGESEKQLDQAFYRLKWDAFGNAEWRLLLLVVEAYRDGHIPDSLLIAQTLHNWLCIRPERAPEEGHQQQRRTSLESNFISLKSAEETGDFSCSFLKALHESPQSLLPRVMNLKRQFVWRCLFEFLLRFPREIRISEKNMIYIKHNFIDWHEAPLVRLLYFFHVIHAHSHRASPYDFYGNGSGNYTTQTNKRASGSPSSLKDLLTESQALHLTQHHPYSAWFSNQVERLLPRENDYLQAHASQLSLLPSLFSRYLESHQKLIDQLLALLGAPDKLSAWPSSTLAKLDAMVEEKLMTLVAVRGPARNIPGGRRFHLQVGEKSSSWGTQSLSPSPMAQKMMPSLSSKPTPSSSAQKFMSPSTAQSSMSTSPVLMSTLSSVPTQIPQRQALSSPLPSYSSSPMSSSSSSSPPPILGKSFVIGPNGRLITNNNKSKAMRPLSTGPDSAMEDAEVIKAIAAAAMKLGLVGTLKAMLKNLAWHGHLLQALLRVDHLRLDKWIPERSLFKALVEGQAEQPLGLEALMAILRLQTWYPLEVMIVNMQRFMSIEFKALLGQYSASSHANTCSSLIRILQEY